MSTLKVNSIEANTGSEIDINSTLGTIPSIIISGVTTVAAGSTAAPSITPTGDSNTGIFFPAADTIAIGEGGAEAARFDSSGRLLVGTSSAASGGTYSSNSLIRVLGLPSDSTTWSAINLARGQAATAPITAEQDIGIITFSDSVGYEFATIRCMADAQSGANDYPGRLVFSTTADGASSPTERMRINSAGLVAINTASKLDSNNVSLAVKGAYPTTPVEIQQDTTSSHFVITFRNANGLVGNITTSGSATSFNTSSDYRLKENVEPVADGITRLQQLKPSRFNFIADPDKTVDGFIAHEVQAVVPEAIHGEKDEVDNDGKPVYQGIDQSKLVPLLTAALQEAIAKIEQLEARLTAAGIE